MSLSVGVFTYSTKPRGSVVHAAALVEALARLGHDATLYALHKDGEGFYRRLRARLVLVPAAPAPSGTDALVGQRIAEVAAFVQASRPAHDVLHAEDCLVGSGLLEARSRRPTPPLVRTVHHVERFESPYLDRCQARSIRGADALASVSETTRREVERDFSLSSTVVGNGVDTERFSKRDPFREGVIRRKLRVSGMGPLVLSVGGVEERKNTLRMLEAFVRVRAVHPAATWVIAGGASVLDHSVYATAFDERLAELPSDARAAVCRAGVIDDDEMTALLQTADVLLHAATQEGFGLAVLEALAARKPVVVSHLSPFDEYLDDSCAHFVTPTSAESIAEGVLRALAAPDRTARAGHARATEYSWTACARAHVKLYERTLAAASHPSARSLTCPKCISTSAGQTGAASAATRRP